jgi:hypothetical protein
VFGGEEDSGAVYGYSFLETLEALYPKRVARGPRITAKFLGRVRVMEGEEMRRDVRSVVDPPKFFRSCCDCSFDVFFFCDVCLDCQTLALFQQTISHPGKGDMRKLQEFHMRQ